MMEQMGGAGGAGGLGGLGGDDLDSDDEDVVPEGDDADAAEPKGKGKESAEVSPMCRQEEIQR